MRRRITLIATVIVAVVLTAVAAAAVVAVRAEILDNLDRSLDQRAAEIEASIDRGATTLVTSNREDRFAQILAPDGTIVAATDNAAAISFADRLPVDGRTSFTATGLPIEDDSYRVLIRPIPDGFVVVGENIDDQRDTTRALIATLLLVVPLAVALLAGAVWWLVGRTLRPVEAIRREVDDIGVGDLERRVPITGTRDEVDRLAVTMNVMLERLESSVERQRRFVADASHELRTPLTRLRTSLEVDLAGSDPGGRATVASALEDTVQMQVLIDDLLFLARRDARIERVPHEPVDLDVVVRDEVRETRTADREPTITTTDVGAAAVVGDERALRRLVRNLLSNAVRHATAAVHVGLRDDGTTVELTVADDGPGVAAVDRERIFERFVRLDASRSAAGTGLGLAIVEEIAVDHGGSVSVAESPGGGATFVVSLPSAPRTIDSHHGAVPAARLSR